MMDLLKELFSSKKFVVMLAAMIVAVASKAGLALNPDLINQILALAGVFILGQGVADHGKEAAKVSAAATMTAMAATVAAPVAEPVADPAPVPAAKGKKS